MKVNPTAMVGAACAGMFRFLVGAAALALCVTSSASPSGVVFIAFVGAYLVFSGLAKVGGAHGAASDLEDALDRPDAEPVSSLPPDLQPKGHG